MDILTPSKQLFTQRYTTPNPPHGHTMWEISILEKGSVVHTLNNKTIEASPGSVLIMGKSHIHSIQSISDHIHWDIYIKDEDFKRICDSFDSKLYDKINFNEILVHFRLSNLKLSQIIFDLKDLTKYQISLMLNLENFTYNEGYNITLSLVSYLMMQYIATIKFTTTNENWIQDTLSNLQNPEIFTRRISDIISIAHYSHSQYTNLFKKYTGTTLIKYIQNKRLEYAKELLLNTNETVLDISLRCGYDSINYFIRIFKATYKVTPLQFRLSHFDSLNKVK